MRIPGNRHACIGLVAAMGWAACGGEAEQSRLAGDDGAALATDAGAGDENSGGADPAAKIRLVNLWVDEGTGAPVDVHMSPLMSDERPLFQDVGFGTVTATTSVPADARITFYRAGNAASGEEIATHFLSSRDLEGGDQLTLVLGYTRPIREGGMTGVVEVFQDTGQFVSGGMPARPVDGTLLVISVSPANRILGDARDSFTFGSRGQGCLRPAGSPPPSSGGGAITTSLGGTAIITYDVQPGVQQIAAYGSDTSQCEGSPRIGPVEVDVAATGRTYLFAYGTGPNDLRLLPVAPSAEN